MKRISKFLILFLIFLIPLTGCSSKSEEATASIERGAEQPAFDEMDSLQVMPAEEAEFSIAESSDPFLDTIPLLQDQDRKITYSGSASIETETFDETLSALEQWLQSFNGMISSSRIEDYGSYNQPRRHASYTIKIPAENFQQALQVLKNQMEIRRIQLDSQDVTDHYYDLTARIESAQTHEARLLDLVEKSTELKDVLALEQELNRIRYEIESNQGVLRRIDNQVRYSTLHLDVQETNILLPEPESFWDRVQNQMVRAKQQVVNGVQDLILWLILWLPPLIIFGVFVFIIIRFFKKLKPVWKKKKDPLESDHK